MPELYARCLISKKKDNLVLIYFLFVVENARKRWKNLRDKMNREMKETGKQRSGADGDILAHTKDHGTILKTCRF